jgi:hypothetical protein
MDSWQHLDCSTSDINHYERANSKLQNMVFSTTIMQLIPDKILPNDPLTKSCKPATRNFVLNETQQNLYMKGDIKLLA